LSILSGLVVDSGSAWAFADEGQPLGYGSVWRLYEEDAKPTETVWAELLREHARKGLWSSQ